MNYYKEAMKERIAADEMAEEAGEDYKWYPSEAEIYEKKADAHWERHVQLLKKVYPAPNPHHPIQVLLKDKTWWNGHEEAEVLKTSFETLPEYIEAEERLGHDYYLETISVGQCEMCDKYYFEKNGYTAYKSGFCSLECLEEDELIREIEAEYVQSNTQNVQ